MQFISVTALQTQKLNWMRQAKQKKHYQHHHVQLHLQACFCLYHHPYDFQFFSYLPCWAHRMKSLIAQYDVNMNQTLKHSTEQHIVVKQWQQKEVTGHNADLRTPSNHLSHKNCITLMTMSGHKQGTCSMLSVAEKTVPDDECSTSSYL